MSITSGVDVRLGHPGGQGQLVFRLTSWSPKKGKGNEFNKWNSLGQHCPQNFVWIFDQIVPWSRSFYVRQCWSKQHSAQKKTRSFCGSAWVCWDFGSGILVRLNLQDWGPKLLPIVAPWPVWSSKFRGAWKFKMFFFEPGRDVFIDNELAYRMFSKMHLFRFDCHWSKPVCC